MRFQEDGCWVALSNVSGHPLESLLIVVGPGFRIVAVCGPEIAVRPEPLTVCSHLLAGYVVICRISHQTIDAGLERLEETLGIDERDIRAHANCEWNFPVVS